MSGELNWRIETGSRETSYEVEAVVQVEADKN